MAEIVKFKLGKFLYPVSLTREKGKIYVQFGYNKNLIAEIKSMEGSHWCGYDEPPKKIWRIDDTQRNQFQLDYLQSKNPYTRYDAPLVIEDFAPRFHTIKNQAFKLFNHQPETIAHMVQRHGSIIGEEMGLAKTLCAIIAMEKAVEQYGLPARRWWYVAPKSVLDAVKREFRIWGAKVIPEFMTYDALIKKMQTWKAGDPAPFGVIYDEMSKLKNFTTQRAQAAYGLSCAIRNEWKDSGYVIGMTGTPAPKDPTNWWSLCEIVCPGFLKEGDIHKFKRRLAIVEMKQDVYGGGVYPQLIRWRDSELICDICGMEKADILHNPLIPNPKHHKFIAAKNEVHHLYERLKGLVLVKFKKDCLDLPDKVYRTITVEPTPSLKRAAGLLVKSSKTVIEGLTRLRELSDGFQYIDKEDGMKPCELCHGSKLSTHYEEVPGTCDRCSEIIKMGAPLNFVCPEHNPKRQAIEGQCERCKGTGQEKKFIRHTAVVDCPKDQALVDLLEENDDIGRIVIYAGFQGSIERCVRICQREGWDIIQMNDSKIQVMDSKGKFLDGSSWGQDQNQKLDYLTLFQEKKEQHPRVAFIAHPGSGGMGLTLTAAAMIVFFSNTFNAEERMQSEDRIHRPSMDLNLGATIVDIVHLPSDLKVIENLQRKRDLQAMTLGEVAKSIEIAEEIRSI